MIQNRIFAALAGAFAVSLLLAISASPGFAAEAEEGETQHYPINKPRNVDWTFNGPFGKFDPAQLQRGFQVYREVCSGCHSLSMVAFRNLASETGPHFTEDQARALAAEYQIPDQDSNGETIERPAVLPIISRVRSPTRRLLARPMAAHIRPTCRLSPKARAVIRGFPTFIFDIFTQYQEGGPDYIYSLLTGYQEPPPGEEIREGQYYNPYFISGRRSPCPRRSPTGRSATLRMPTRIRPTTFPPLSTSILRM
jgi:ubiquinol-cytochrome c reductase cytochrome c1 subunit